MENIEKAEKAGHLLLEVVRPCFTVCETNWQWGMSSENCYTSLEKARRKIQGRNYGPVSSASIPEISKEEVFMKVPPLPSHCMPWQFKKSSEKKWAESDCVILFHIWLLAWWFGGGRSVVFLWVILFCVTFSLHLSKRKELAGITSIFKCQKLKHVDLKEACSSVEYLNVKYVPIVRIHRMESKNYYLL